MEKYGIQIVAIPMAAMNVIPASRMVAMNVLPASGMAALMGFAQMRETEKVGGKMQ